MKNFNYILGLALILGLGFTAKAQPDDADAEHTITVSVPDVALLDLETSDQLDFTLEFTANEAGLPLEEAQNTDTWINYTSVVTSTTTRNVSVKASGAIPSGYILSVVAGNDVGNGAGTVGTPGAEVNISTTDQNLITGIGSVYTGNGASNGHQLTYTLAPDATNFGDLDHTSSSNVVVVYTISDDQ